MTRSGKSCTFDSQLISRTYSYQVQKNEVGTIIGKTNRKGVQVRFGKQCWGLRPHQIEPTRTVDNFRKQQPHTGRQESREISKNLRRRLVNEEIASQPKFKVGDRVRSLLFDVSRLDDTCTIKFGSRGKVTHRFNKENGYWYEVDFENCKTCWRVFEKDLCSVSEFTANLPGGFHIGQKVVSRISVKGSTYFFDKKGNFKTENHQLQTNEVGTVVGKSNKENVWVVFGQQHCWPLRPHQIEPVRTVDTFRRQQPRRGTTGFGSRRSRRKRDPGSRLGTV